MPRLRAKSPVLAVDDEPPVLNVLKRILQREGYNVDTAQNGVDAIFSSSRTIINS